MLKLEKDVYRILVGRCEFVMIVGTKDLASKGAGIVTSMHTRHRLPLRRVG